MTLLIDAGPVVAGADETDPRYEKVAAIFKNHPGPFIIPAPVTAEIDYLIGERAGEFARLGFIEDLAAVRFSVECLTEADYRVATKVANRYSALRLSLADLSLIVLAERLGTRVIVTFDERDFRAVTPLQGGAFKLLPADLD